MCTLIIGRDVVTPGSVLLAANRDEDPGRPSDPPAVLGDRPRLVGGRDRRAGGTWLAVRDARAVVAVLNRRDPAAAAASPAAPRRSRGALVLEVAGVAEEAAGAGSAGWDGAALAAAARDRAAAALGDGRFAPCTLVFATPGSAWVMALEADGAPRFADLPAGWHVVTHAEVDDPDEPRTARLMRELAGFAPRSRDEAEARLEALLRSHGDPAAGVPPVCLHAGRMVTVSTSIVWLAAGEACYRHAEGRPCEHALVDHSALLGAGGGGTAGR